MTLIVNAGTLFAQADAYDPKHEAVVTLLEGQRGPLVTSQVAVTEADYLILTRLGVDVELAFLDDLATGTGTGRAAVPIRPKGFESEKDDLLLRRLA